jgi:hypothetical protein
VYKDYETEKEAKAQERALVPFYLWNISANDAVNLSNITVEQEFLRGRIIVPCVM